MIYNPEKVYRIVIWILVWGFSIYLTWTKASSNLKDTISREVSSEVNIHTDEARRRFDEIDRHLAVIDAKIDRVMVRKEYK